MIRKRVAGLAGLAALATGALVQPAPATASTPGVPFCQLMLASTTSGGDLIFRGLYGVVPPGASPSRWGGKDLLPDNQVRLTSGLGVERNADQSAVESRRQYVVLGSTLNLLTYEANGYSDEVDRSTLKLTPIGGGWGAVRYLESSRFTVVRR